MVNDWRKQRNGKIDMFMLGTIRDVMVKMGVGINTTMMREIHDELYGKPWRVSMIENLIAKKRDGR